MTSGPNPKLDELIEVMAVLRGPGGCPWDAEQTHESLIRYLLEETYELIDAIETGDRDDMIEELGAVLLAMVASARSQGLDAERALRSRLRDLQDDIRDAE